MQSQDTFVLCMLRMDMFLANDLHMRFACCRL